MSGGYKEVVWSDIKGVSGGSEEGVSKVLKLGSGQDTSVKVGPRHFKTG